MKQTEALGLLRENDREVCLLAHTAAVLGWDQETYMPSRAIGERAQQLSLLQALIHRRVVEEKNGEAFAALGSGDEEPRGDVSLPPADRAFLRQAYRRYALATKLPERLVVALAQETSKGQAVWQAARQASDFSAFEPTLGRIVRLVREKADLWGYDDHPYDPLLDEFEPGMKTSEVQRNFDGLQEGLSALLDRIRGATQVEDAFLHRDFAVGTQEQFSREILAALGFDSSRGRLDVSTHPFTTTLGFDDVRITTRYNPDLFQTAIFGTIHEAGHALYEMGFEESLRGSLLAEGTSLGIHESQSRFWENVVGRSRSFWRRYFPRLKELFPQALDSVDQDAFFRGVNKVAPSLIRVEADEVTYGLHIILRFRLEIELITRRLEVSDLPEAWNQLSQELLGIAPERDADGVLQDIHWSMGAFGYFPTYALGNLYAAQFTEALQGDLPSFEGLIEAGNFQPILQWLRSNIHRHGGAKVPSELLRDIVGAALGPGAFTDYLQAKYRDVYRLS